jgi:4-hydroxy-2-oxoglutarate aldolase
MKLQGIYIPIAIPFDHTGEIYSVKVEHNIDKWNRTSVSGYVVCGSESPYISTEEKIRMWEWAVKYAGDKTLIASIAMPSVHESVALAKKAASIGMKAAWVPSADHLYTGAIADASPIPVITDAAITDLAAHFAGGTTFAIAEIANAIPYATISIYEAHRTRETEAAQDWQKRITPAIDAVKKYGPAALKHAMDLNGYYGGLARLPLTGLTPAAKQEIERAFDGIKG